MEIQKERHATHLLHAHLVFVTKYRYKVLKGRSSRLLRRDIPDIKEKYWGKAGLWHRSYFAGSVGGTPLERGGFTLRPDKSFVNYMYIF